MLLREIIFWLLVVDSVSCNLIIWFEKAWYLRHFRIVSRLFPAAKGWTTWYLILVVWIGYLTYSAA